MSTERMESELRPGDFRFRVERHTERKAVSLWDGADQYTFILRNGKPFAVARPGERDMSKEKWRALMQQAGAILQELR